MACPSCGTHLAHLVQDDVFPRAARGRGTEYMRYALGDQNARSHPTARAAGVADRIHLIDMLRGFALCGILLLHVPIFAAPGAPPGMGASHGPMDPVVNAALIMFVEAKFFSLFAALFGLSFALQWQSAEARGRPFVPTFRRRLLFLAMFGALHVLLLWESDILLLYAAAGLLLIPLRNVSPARLLRWVVGLLAVPLVVYLLALGALALARLDPTSAATLAAGEARFSAAFAASVAEVTARYAGADVAQAMVGRAGDYLLRLPLLLTRLPAVLAMMLLGFCVGKLGLLRDVEAHLPLLRRARAWGLGAGLLFSALVTLAYTGLPPFAALTALGLNQVLAGPVLAIGYAATFVLLARRPGVGRLLAPLASYGRTALTSYLLQSALCGLLFYGYGLGLVGQVGSLAALLIAVALNGLLIALSGLWLRHFAIGPAEWLWRSLTAGRAQTLRRERGQAGGRAVAPSARTSL